MENVEFDKRDFADDIGVQLHADALIRHQDAELLQEDEDGEAPHEARERDRLLVQMSPDAILLACEHRIVFANPAASRLFRAADPVELLGKTLESLAAPAYRDNMAATTAQLHDGPPPAGMLQEQAQCLDGTLVDVAVTRLPFKYRGKPAIHMVARDISDIKRRETQLLHQATHDALTGLPNRTLLVDRLHLAIAEAKRYQERFMVAFIDLDRFKWINDSYGHDVGDALLKAVSARMSSCLRESDTIARLSGDEFVLVLRDSGNGEESMQVLNRVVGCVSTPIKIDGREISVTCSMGCCTYPDDGEDPEALLRFSDVAMYRAKENGRNGMRQYDADLRHRFDERAKVASELRHALERDQFTLHYQLQVDLKSGAIAGLEALLRWHHPQLGNIEPRRFLPIAEETGLIEPIGDWVIHQACRQNKLWQMAGLAPVRIAINLSARELARPGLENRIARCLAETRINPEYLELELTESASMEDPDKSLRIMRKLRELGIGVSIDDFGTGYSNMQYLQRFPIEKLKLDGSFTGDIAKDTGSLAVTDAIVFVAHRLGIKVVAEMAETEDQVALLTASGCDQVQGFYFSAPLCADDCIEVLRAGSVPLHSPAIDGRPAPLI